MLEPQGSKHVELMLDYFPNADHAGIYAAQAGGDFEQAGLDVAIRQPPDPAAPIKQVAAGRVDLAISYEPEVLRARDQGLPVVSVAAIVQKPLTSIISLPEAKIREPADLEGKTVGTAGIDYQSAYLRTILLEAGVRPDTVKERNVGFGLTPGAADRQGRRRAGRLLELRGHRAAPEGQAAAHHPHGRGRRAVLQRAGPGGERATRSSATPTRSAPSSARCRAARVTCARTPTRRSRASSRRTRTSTPSCSGRWSRSRCRSSSRHEGKPFGWQDPAQWDAFAAWMKDNRCSSTHPMRAPPTTTSCCPARGSEGAQPGGSRSSRSSASELMQ